MVHQKLILVSTTCILLSPEVLVELERPKKLEVNTYEIVSEQLNCNIKKSSISKSYCRDNGTKDPYDDYYEISFSITPIGNVNLERIELSGAVDTTLFWSEENFSFEKIRIPANNKFHELVFEFKGKNLGDECDHIVLLMPVAPCSE